MGVTQSIRETISDLLDDLPAESLPLVEQFVRFLRLQSPATPQPAYPTVTMPAASLEGWSKLLGQGYDGDALADSESLHDGR